MPLLGPDMPKEWWDRELEHFKELTEKKPMTPPPSSPTPTPRTIDYKLELDDGKYIYIRYKEGGQVALRYGEEWRDLTGDNLIYFMAYAVEEARADRDQWKQMAEDAFTPVNKCYCAIQGYKDTNKLHDASVLNLARLSAKEWLSRFTTLNKEKTE